MKKAVVYICTGIFLLNLLIGCTRNEEENYQESEAENPKLIWKEGYDYKMEDINDPETFKEPRLQFLWESPGDEDRTIWTIKLDGTDFQKVMTHAFLYSKGSNINFPPERSPDKRYMVISMQWNDYKHHRTLFDLKDKTVVSMVSGGVMPCIQWTHDSRYTYFYADAHLWKYDVKKKVLKENFWIGSQGFYILKDGSFLSVSDTGYNLFTRTGKKIKTVHIAKNITEYHDLSKNEDLLFLTDFKSSYIVNLKKNYDIIFKNDINPRFLSFGPEGKYVYYSDVDVLYKIDIKTHKKTLIIDLSYSPGRISHISLLNRTGK